MNIRQISFWASVSQYEIAMLIVVEFPAVQTAFDAQHAVSEGRAVKPFFKTGDIVGTGFGFPVNSDDV